MLRNDHDGEVMWKKTKQIGLLLSAKWYKGYQQPIVGGWGVAVPLPTGKAATLALPITTARAYTPSPPQWSIARLAGLSLARTVGPAACGHGGHRGVDGHLVDQ